MQRVLSDELFGEIKPLPSSIRRSYDRPGPSRKVYVMNCTTSLGMEWGNDRASLPHSHHANTHTTGSCRKSSL